MAHSHAAARTRTHTPADSGPATPSPRAVAQPKRGGSLRRPTTVQRPGVVNRLRVARSASVVLISAPPGYGKTTVAAEWARRDGRPFAWITVDSDDDARTFAAHFGTAVVHALGQTRRASIVRRLPAEEMVAYLGRVLASSATPIVVVVDDVDRLGDRDARRLLMRFADELPPESQLVLVGRSSGDLPLARLRVRGRLVELGADELRFTNREAAALMHNADVDLTPGQVDALNRALEGWPTGLHLAALALHAEDADLEELLRDGVASAHGYLRAELLTGMSSGDAAFLARVSVLERLCGPLCDAVADMTGSADRLEELERSNSFVTALDRERRWYRIHPAFRRVLRMELERREPGIGPELQRRAAAWCGSHGDPQLSLEYARAGGDVEQLVELVERTVVPLIPEAPPERIAGWLEQLDAQVIAQRPSVSALGALTWALIGRPEESERWFAALVRSSGSRRAFPTLLRTLAAPRDAKQLRLAAERALRGLSLGSDWRALVLVVLGRAYVLEGSEAKAESALREAEDTAAAAGERVVECMALAHRCLLANDQGRWADADVLADAVRSQVRKAGLENHVTTLFALAASARTALRNGDWSTVHADLVRADTLLPQLTYVLAGFSVSLRLEFARVHAALGDTRGAALLLDQVDDVFARRPHLGLYRDDAELLRVELAADAERTAGRMATLTAAELRLLPLLTTHLSFREIAERLYVSRNTVKTQAISVYRKLGVSSRGAAIDRASSLGLVSSEDNGGST